jgi:hypothetical protein
MSSIPFFFKNKQALIDALEALRPAVAKADKEATSKHKQDEQRYLAHFRRSVREEAKQLLKLDYDAAKRRGRWDGVLIAVKDEAGKLAEIPSCPSSKVQILDQAIALVQRSPERSFRINESGQYALIHRVLTLGISDVGRVC